MVSAQVPVLDPATYGRHPIHRDGRIWAETNCYVDIWIELLHALGHEPIAALPFTVAIDFEGDQWTFFKFPLPDLYDLYGLDVQELVIWRPLAWHVEEQVSRGRPVLVELDSYYLPDTAGMAYQQTHVKTTVAVTAIDLARSTLGYFHGQGYHQLRGEDFLEVLHLRHPVDAGWLPPYVEFVKLRDTPRRDAASIVGTSRALLARHLRLVPRANPFVGFRARFERDLAGLLDQDLDVFHQYSFATLRQFGACYELTATYLEWLTAHGDPGLDGPRRAFLSLAEGAKRLQFHLARTITRRTSLDLTPLDEMASCWEKGITALRARYA